MMVGEECGSSSLRWRKKIAWIFFLLYRCLCKNHVKVTWHRVTVLGFQQKMHMNRNEIYILDPHVTAQEEQANKWWWRKSTRRNGDYSRKYPRWKLARVQREYGRYSRYLLPYRTSSNFWLYLPYRIDMVRTPTVERGPTKGLIILSTNSYVDNYCRASLSLAKERRCSENWSPRSALFWEHRVESTSTQYRKQTLRFWNKFYIKKRGL